MVEREKEDSLARERIEDSLISDYLKNDFFEITMQTFLISALMNLAAVLKVLVVAVTVTNRPVREMAFPVALREMALAVAMVLLLSVFAGRLGN